MQSKKSKRTAASRSSVPTPTQVVFFSLLVVVFVMWVVYRSVFSFPVWFDEIVGKAIFFGLPVSLYISLTSASAIRQTYAVGRMYKGLLMGVAIGGVFGFAATLTSFASRGVVVQAAPLFLSNNFWSEFFLALMTGFWESLFFFCWIMVIIQEKYKNWGLPGQLLLVVAIFVVFHIPNIILRSPSMMIGLNQVVLLAIFALGQGLLFARTRNLYTLTISQAIWGMVLLVHT